MAASGQFCWPRPGSYLAASGHNLMATDKALRLADVSAFSSVM